MFSKRTEKPGIDRHRSLEGIPIVNEGVQTSAESDRATVVVRWSRPAGFLARFQPRTMERTVRLDELGTFVLRQIDGQKDVLQIIDAFVQRYRINRREAELSTVAFLRSLAERNVISIVIR